MINLCLFLLIQNIEAEFIRYDDNFIFGFIKNKGTHQNPTPEKAANVN